MSVRTGASAKTIHIAFMAGKSITRRLSEERSSWAYCAETARSIGGDLTELGQGSSAVHFEARKELGRSVPAFPPQPPEERNPDDIPL